MTVQLLLFKCFTVTVDKNSPPLKHITQQLELDCTEIFDRIFSPGQVGSLQFLIFLEVGKGEVVKTVMEEFHWEIYLNGFYPVHNYAHGHMAMRGSDLYEGTQDREELLARVQPDDANV